MIITTHQFMHQAVRNKTYTLLTMPGPLPEDFNPTLEHLLGNFITSQNVKFDQDSAPAPDYRFYGNFDKTFAHAPGYLNGQILAKATLTKKGGGPYAPAAYLNIAHISRGSSRNPNEDQELIQVPSDAEFLILDLGGECNLSKVIAQTPSSSHGMWYIKKNGEELSGTLTVPATDAPEGLFTHVKIQVSGSWLPQIIIEGTPVVPTEPEVHEIGHAVLVCRQSFVGSDSAQYIGFGVTVGSGMAADAEIVINTTSVPVGKGINAFRVGLQAEAMTGAPL